MREIIKAMVILAMIPAFMALLATVTASRPYIMPLIFSLLVIFAALSLSEKPRIALSLEFDKDIVHLGEEVSVKVEVSIHEGYGLIMIRGPPIPRTDMAEGFELVKGTNVHVVFKGFRQVHREYEYVLRAVKRGSYPVEGVSFVYYHPFGIVEDTEGSVKVSGVIKVLPRVKLISRLPARVRPKEGVPSFSPSRLGSYSTEFWSVREYVVGYPYKFINWKATARNAGGNLMVNEYEREGVRTIALLMDGSLWMRYGSDVENPLEYGISLVLSLSRVFLRYGYSVGLWVFPKGAKVPPSPDSDQYYRLLRALVEFRGFSEILTLDEAAIRRIAGLKAIALIVTNVTAGNVGEISRISEELRSRALIVDIIPDTILMKNIVGDPPCGKWFVRDRVEGVYGRLPASVKVITWDPACEGVGSVVAKIHRHMMVWDQ